MNYRMISKILGRVMGVEAAEKQGNAPQPGDADQRVNDAAADARLPAEDGGDQVKTENADAAPVKRSDDDQRQCDFMNHAVAPFLRA